MVEAGKSSSQTGELPSSGPIVDGALNPDISLRPKNSNQVIDPISGLTPTDPLAHRVASITDSELNSIEAQTDGSKIIQLQTPRNSKGMAAGASLAAGVAAFSTAAIVENINPDSTKAGGMMATASGDGNICTPEFLAEHPFVIVGGDSNVGGEPTSNADSPLAQSSGSDTAAINNPKDSEHDPNENVIVRFTDPNGRELILSIKPCPLPEAEPIENAWPTEPDQARKMFMRGEIKIQRDKLFIDPATRQTIDLGLWSDRKDALTDNGTFFATVLEVQERKGIHLVLFGTYNKKGKPVTFIQKLDGSFNGEMAYEHLSSKDYELINVPVGRLPISIDEVARDLENNRLGEVVTTINYTKEINIGVPYFDNGLAKVADNNDDLFDYMMAIKKGRKPNVKVVGINTALSEIKNNQIDKLPSVWGIITRGEPPQITN